MTQLIDASAMRQIRAGPVRKAGVHEINEVSWRPLSQAQVQSEGSWALASLECWLNKVWHDRSGCAQEA
eukprot:1556543-Amphidinium_carterae.2